jgi:hypothetical protein
MKGLLLLFVSLLSLNAMAIQKVQLMSGKLYVPEGFDSNDLVEVVVSGKLPDLCYRNPTVEVERDGDTFEIYLYAYHVPVEPCRKIALPYMEKVNLGMLPQGNYKAKLIGEHAPLDTVEIKVTEAISQLQDEFNYGNVMGIRERENSRQIELIGTNPVNCLKFVKMETVIQAKVIVLKPHFKEQGECKEMPTPFSIKYEVPFLPQHPRGLLLHVRVMDGRSYNYLFRNKL